MENVSLLKGNEEVVEIPSDSPLGRRGVSSVTIKPLNWKKEKRAIDIVEGKALAMMDDPKYKRLMDERGIGGDDKPKPPKPPEEDKSEDEIVSGKVDAFSPAWPYIVYSGTKEINKVKAPDVPKGMLDDGDSPDDGWMDECTSLEVKQIASIILDRTGMIETKATEGNGSGASMQPPATESA